MSINLSSFTHCGRQRCIQLCARSHQAGPVNSIHVLRHRRGTRAAICGHLYAGQPLSTQSHTWGGPAKNKSIVATLPIQD